MEYSIQELSHLSGVTTRTLRWYDQIGLLKPSRTAESGYRYYGPAEVDRLQDILYYRALGVELARIRECLDDPTFDRLAAPATPSGRFGSRAGATGKADSIRKMHHQSRRKEEIMNDERNLKSSKSRL